MLAKWDDFRTLGWVGLIENPGEMTVKTQQY